jgi:Ca2+-binding RTX toxin-like protein
MATVIGISGADSLAGLGGGDLRDGAKDADRLNGAAGLDTLRGGEGEDLPCVAGDVPFVSGYPSGDGRLPGWR